jgi:type I restriction enzyme S subunit
MARAQTITGGRDATAAVIPGRYALSVGMPNVPAPEGWNWTPLSSVARLESGHTPSRRHPEYWGGSIPWIGIRDATGNHGHVIHETIEFTNELGIENSSARVLPKDTVCLSRTASVGYVVVTGRPMSTSQDFVNWICSDNLNPHFLKYVLLAEREALLMFAVGSVHQTIYFPEAKAFHICMPDRREQDSIVEVLGPLDDKIELNRRMNETLEAMARAIFKDWFVDFGPTRAKMEGRAPYLAPDIWSLFPDRLDDEGKPEGWNQVPLAALVEVNPTEALARGVPAPYLDMASIPTVGPNSDPYVSREFGSGMRFRNGDALLARITPCLENGKTAFVQNLPDGEVGWGSTEFIVLRARTPVPKAVSYIIARDPTFRANAIRSMTGTSGRQRASSDAVAAFQLVCPFENRIWRALGSLIDPMFARMAANDRESRTLTDMRDLLLPKLMSGEVCVKDAEKLVGEVA